MLAGVITACAQQMTMYKMKGGSMDPTIRPNEIAHVDELAYRRHGPQRGDVVLTWVSPVEARGHRWRTVKRVIGVPGDRIEVRDGSVFINGAQPAEPYVRCHARYRMSEVRVPVEQYFVLGDNRSASADAHVWGTVPRKNIIGKVVLHP